jgi:hypothetical protein
MAVKISVIVLGDAERREQAWREFNELVARTPSITYYQWPDGEDFEYGYRDAIEGPDRAVYCVLAKLIKTYPDLAVVWFAQSNDLGWSRSGVGLYHQVAQRDAAGSVGRPQGIRR